MLIYRIFVKDRQVVALNKSAANVDDRPGLLEAGGYQKQFEELPAASEQAALARFADIKSEERKTEDAFAMGSLFDAVTNVVLKGLSHGS